VVNPALERGSVEVVTGLDFSTVHDQPTPVEQTTTTAAGSPAGSASTTASSSTTTTRPTTTTTAPPPTTEPAGHAVGEAPAGAHCG
jgi:hypothetical protein